MDQMSKSEHMEQIISRGGYHVMPKGEPLLPHDAAERKEIPVYSGVLAYFPLALIEIAKLSKRGNDQHNPGSPLHWDRAKSGDELDALVRHLLELNDNSVDSIEAATAVAWRALANLQKMMEDKT